MKLVPQQSKHRSQAHIDPDPVSPRPNPQVELLPTSTVSDPQSADLSYIDDLKPLGIEPYLTHWLQEFSSHNYPFYRLRFQAPAEFQVRVWQSVSYQLLSEGTVSQGCRKSLDLNGFSLHDAETAGSVSTTDWLSDRDHALNPVTTKERLAGLSSDEKTLLYLAIQGQVETLEGPLVEVLDEITVIAAQLSRRYDWLFTAILAGQTPTTLHTTIHELFTSTLRRCEISQEMLCERDQLSKVGSIIALELAQKAEAVSETSFLLEEQVFEFGDIEDTPFHQRILPFKVNPLTDFELQAERTTVNDQMLTLAKQKTLLDPWKEAVINGRPLPADTTEVLDPLVDLIITRYLLPSLRETCAPAPNPEPPTTPLRPTRATTINTTDHRWTLHANDIFGDNFKRAIEASFMVHFSWSLSGSCLLSAVLDALNPQENYEANRELGYDKVGELRSQIAIQLTEQKQKWMPFFPSENALINHAEEILKSQTYSVDIDIQILAEIIGQPIYVYKRKSGTYRTAPGGQPLPTVVFGEDQPGKPILLFDDHDHYKRLEPNL